MTTEKRIVFDLTDIKNFRWECSECNKDISFYMGPTPAPMSYSCPYCSEPWSSNALSLQMEILRTIMLVLKEEDPPVTLRFEIKGK